MWDMVTMFSSSPKLQSWIMAGKVFFAEYSDAIVKLTFWISNVNTLFHPTRHWCKECTNSHVSKFGHKCAFWRSKQRLTVAFRIGSISSPSEALRQDSDEFVGKSAVWCILPACGGSARVRVFVPPHRHAHAALIKKRGQNHDKSRTVWFAQHQALSSTGWACTVDWPHK